MPRTKHTYKNVHMNIVNMYVNALPISKTSLEILERFPLLLTRYISFD